jgi:DNA-binding response OmpR family regulator
MMIPGKRKLGELLVGRRVISSEQVRAGLDGQATTLLPIGSTLISMNLASERDVASALAEQFGVPGVVVSGSVLATEVLGVIPFEVASAHYVLPLAFRGNALLLALANPSERALVDEIAFASGRAILPHVAPRIAIERSVRAAYDARSTGALTWAGSSAVTGEPRIDVVEPPKTLPPEVEAPAVDLSKGPAPARRGARPAERPTVLAVDDEVEILDIVDKALSHRGMEVVRATRGREALEKLQAVGPDIVLLDAMLPEIHGFEICHKIKQSMEFKHTPVIIISAIYTGWNFVSDIKRIYGADDYMAKPFRVMELVRKVEETLAKAKVRPPSPEVREAHQQADLLIKEASEAMKSENLDKAVAAGERAVQADPFDPRTHFVYGMALHKAGRIYEAISVYERVVELAPAQFAALKNLAVLYERQGFKAKAVEMWMRALDQSPSEPVRQTIKAHLIDLL